MRLHAWEMTALLGAGAAVVQLAETRGI